MDDIVAVGGALVLFALCAGYVRACARLVSAPREGVGDDRA
jgi:hypothetical protein